MNTHSFFLMLFSSLLFTLSTVFAKYVNNAGKIDAQEVSFIRFILGFVIVFIMRIGWNFKVRPVIKKGLYLRAVYNTLAVILFYMAVEYSSITNANLLNMTYPVFVAICSVYVLKEKITSRNLTAIIISLAGAVLIIKPFSLTALNIGDIYGILSAVVAGLAISYLKFAANTEDTFTILYYLFFYGTILSFLFSFKTIVMPDQKQAVILILSALTAIAGQWVLTYAMKFATATQSSIVSMSRIFFAAIIGIYLFGDKIDIFLIAGSILIILPNIILLK